MEMATAIKDNRDGKVYIERDAGMVRPFETILGHGTVAQLSAKYPDAKNLMTQKKFIDTDELDDCGF
jgi:hypothetical protein